MPFLNSQLSVTGGGGGRGLVLGGRVGGRIPQVVYPTLNSPLLLKKFCHMHTGPLGDRVIISGRSQRFLTLWIFYIYGSIWVYIWFFILTYRVPIESGELSNFNQSDARNHCFLASNWLKFENPPQKYCTLLIMKISYCGMFMIKSCSRPFNLSADFAQY